jgi:citrate synthase
MEGPQGGCNKARQGVYYMPEEQGRAHSPNEITTTLTHSIAQVGEHIHGFHHRVEKNIGEGLHFFSGI